MLTEVCYDHSQMQTYVHKEWDDLQPGDILYLVSLQEGKVQHVRGGEVVEQFDEKHWRLSHRPGDSKQQGQGYKRKVNLLLDSFQYKSDVEHQIVSQVYSKFHLLVRRGRKENVYKSILSNIRGLMDSPSPLSRPFTDMVLGYSFNLKDSKQDGSTFETMILDDQERFTEQQHLCIERAMGEGVTLVEGPPGTGKTEVVVEIIRRLSLDKSNRLVVISQNKSALEELLGKIEARGQIDSRYILRMGRNKKVPGQDYSRAGRIAYLETLRVQLIQQVYLIQESIGSTYSSDYSIETALIFYQWQVVPRLNAPVFPFHKYQQTLGLSQSETQARIMQVFEELREMRYLEMIRNRHQKEEYLLGEFSRVILMTSTHAAMKQAEYRRLGLSYQSIIFEESAQILDIQQFLAMGMQ